MEDFTEKVMFSDDEEILYSGLVLKELRFKLTDDLFREKQLFLNKEFRFVKVTEEDYTFARKVEPECDLSFYDCLHIAVCKRLNAVLVTRDNDLIKFARRYITAEKPEDILS